MRLQLRSILPLLSLTLALVPVSSICAATIDTMSSWTGSYIFDFGEPNTATYGQTINTDSTDLYLRQFSFLINTTDGTAKFATYVMKWDSINSVVTGSILFQGQMITNTGGFNEISVNPNILLEPNSQYALFYSASNYFDSQDDKTIFANTVDLYSGGQFIYNNNGNDFATLSTSGWITNHIGSGDLAFKATLSSSVPEPSAYALATIAGFVITATARRRTKGN